MRVFVLAVAVLLPGLLPGFAAAQGLPGEPAAPSYGPPQARQAPMMGMRSMDTDGDGAISRQEFMAGHMGADARFAALDADKDGAVSREEYLAAGRENREARFQAMDSNGDGRLTREELDARRTAMFDAMDADRDGRITANEMQRASRKGMPPQQSEMPR